MNYGRALLYGLVFTTLISSSASTREEEKRAVVDKQPQEQGQQQQQQGRTGVDLNSHKVGQEDEKPMPKVRIVTDASGGDDKIDNSKSSKPFKQLPSCNSQQHKKQIPDSKQQEEVNYGGVDSLEDRETNDRPLIATGSAGTSNNLSSARHFLVSTLDGKLTLLDQTGKEVWSLYTGELFSSTISSLQLSENGKWVNLIPSLTGGLYKYDEESLLPMPMNVDTLLHKSFKLSNDVVINGGKELRTLGIDLKTGRLRYDCGMAGCVNHQSNELEEAGAEEPVTLVVKKQLQTVRAVDTQSGTEKWNFSVGTNEMGLTGVVDGCMSEEDDGDHSIPRGALGFVKVVIPEGRLLSADPLSKTVWDKKFTSPIAQAWVVEQGRLTYVDPVQNTPLKEGSLAIYVGRHNHQFYVQESRAVSQKLEKLMGYPMAAALDVNKPLKISWKPSYMISEDLSDSEDSGDDDTGTALTTLNGIRPTMRPFYVLEHDEISSDSLEFVDASTTTPTPPRKDHATTTDSSDDDEEKLEGDSIFDRFDFGGEDGPITVINQVFIASLWVWWKEVLGISLLTAVLLNIILMRPLMRAVRVQTIRDIIRYLREFVNKDQEGQLVPSPNPELLPLMGSSDSPISMESIISRPRTISDSFTSSYGGGGGVEFPEKEIPYLSQYLREFEPVQCLGKGGFGVVYEAKKKIDDRNYAVKRISLPNREEARVRVMREVKALAQLDHRHIVRYFNAWIEHPPNGWLEKNDPLWTNCNIGSMSPTADEPVSDFPVSTGGGDNLTPHGDRHGRRRRCALKRDFDVSAPLVEEDSFIVFDENVEISSKQEFPEMSEGYAEGPFLEMHSLKHEGDTTIDISSDLSTSHGAGGFFWKKPDHNSVSWNEMSSMEFSKLDSFSRLTVSKSRVVFESEVGACGDNAAALTDNDDVEVGEEAQEIESVSVMYLYIQQELCQKRTLREWLRTETTRELRTVVNFFSQIVAAVEYVHSKKLIHRDLKPNNIFLSGNSEGEEHILKIGDFGLATTVLADVNQGISEDNATKHGDKNHPANNLTGQVGTQLYMSPEQFKRKPYDYKVDIYSLGLIFFELIVPFHTEMERHDVLYKLRKVQIPSYFEDSYPQEHSLILQMISHNPNQRPDATSITQWVKNHLREVESFDLGGDDGAADKATTHRSNSSPANISLSRSGSLNSPQPPPSPNDSQIRNDNLFLRKPGGSDGDQQRQRFTKSHSFTSL